MARQFSIFPPLLVCLLVSSPFVFAEEAAAPVSAQSLAKAAELSAAFRSASAKVLPATVKIISHLQTSEDRKAMEIQIPALKPPPGRRYPGDSTGTGVLISSKGLIVTNNHVIANAREIEAELYDGQHFFAKKYRHDPSTDLAVIWLDVPEKEELPFAAFGDSDQMEIGDWVLAIGNPFELDSSVSAGIISAKGRSLRKVQRTELLQTDAAINPGNSGGPLINLRGEIIGINTAIASRSGGNEGIGFALPSNNVQWITEQLIKKDKVVRAWLGVETKPVTPADAKRLGLKQNTGLMVEYVLPNSPAVQTGLKPDDVIQTFDGQPVNAVYQLQRLSERAEIGKEHEIIFFREGKKYKTSAAMKPLPPTLGPFAAPQGSAIHHTDPELGMLLVQATGQMLGNIKISGKQGMLVLAVFSGGRAEKAGLNVGMVIMQIDGKPAATRQQYIDALKRASLSNGIVVDAVLPGGTTRTFMIR
ncbi:MAG: trypsin-like peptidase domain-containing protein [Planctomycetaceae bacterium]|nr:trypsin-like peptidase domain-containing protein [Planctomycetaceae bacterium]